MVKQAVILAGGFGTRLSTVVLDVPKPMAPILNTPFLDYQISLLKSNGITNILILTGYKSEIIEKHFSNCSNIHCIKEPKPLGTLGSILNAYSLLHDEFFVINGDTFFDIDFNILYQFSLDKDAVIALRYTDDISRYGFTKIDKNFKITEFIEKSCLPASTIDGYINGGIYYFKKSIFTSLYKLFKNNLHSIEKELFPYLVKNSKLYGLPIGAAFIDIGIPSDYFKAQDYIPNVLKLKKIPILFVDKDGTLIYDEGYTSGKKITPILKTRDLLIKYKDKGYSFIIVTNQAGLAKNKFSYQDMIDNVNSIKQYYTQYGISFLDVEFCPYHPNAENVSFRFNSIARKPEPGMILRACEKIRIDLSNSFMLGDSSEADIINLPYLQSIIIGD